MMWHFLLCTNFLPIFYQQGLFWDHLYIPNLCDHLWKHAIIKSYMAFILLSFRKFQLGSVKIVGYVSLKYHLRLYPGVICLPWQYLMPHTVYFLCHQIMKFYFIFSGCIEYCSGNAECGFIKHMYDSLCYLYKNSCKLGEQSVLDLTAGNVVFVKYVQGA